MKRFLLVVAALALAAPVSEACGARRSARAKTVTKTKSVARVGVLPTVREVLAAPVKAVGAFLPCPLCR